MLSVQLYSVRDRLERDRDGVLRRLAAIGYRAVEPFRPTDDPHGFRRLADELGLTVSGVHARDLLGDDPDGVLEAATILGAELVIVPAGIPEPAFTTREGVARAAETLNALASRAAAHGLGLAYHNHWWEIEPRIDGEHALEVLARYLDERVGLQLDTYWVVVAGADAVAMLRRLGDRVVSLHLKDGPGVKGAPNQAVGSGVLPLAEILAAAPAAGRVIELEECAGDVFEALAASHAQVTALDRP